MVADVPFIGRNARAFGEVARLFVIAAIVGDDGRAQIPQREADRFPDAAAAPRDDCDTCHDAHLPIIFGSLLKARARTPQDDRNVNLARISADGPISYR